MFVIEGKTKKCSVCKEVKSVDEFHKRKLSKDGLVSECKDCSRIRKQTQRDKPKERIENKRCIRCQEIKSAGDFNKNMHNRDGLSNQCRQCSKLSRKALIKRNPDLPETKVCSTCGIEKPQQQFDKKHESPDGLSYRCKNCRNLSYRMRYIMRALHRDKNKGLRPGIETWEQADNLVREMAELQLTINNEKRACERRVDMIKSDCAQKIRPYVAKQTLLQLTLEDFVTKTCRSARRMVKKCRFGVVAFYRRKLDVVLNIELAAAKIGQP